VTCQQMSTYLPDQAGLLAPLSVENMSQGKGIKLIKITCPKCKASLLVRPGEKLCPVCRHPLPHSGRR
jgi:predicted amidophosphoribosyltransferase